MPKRDKPKAIVHPARFYQAARDTEPADGREPTTKRGKRRLSK